MPDLFLPISFGKHSLKNHIITCWVYDSDRQRLITGALNGELIVWTVQQEGILKPILQMSPHLIYAVGGVTSLILIKRPFSEFQDSRLTCLLTIHEDKRVRMWNVEDGKLFLISESDQFTFTQQITSIFHVGDKDSRYIACFGQGSALYIYDLWKMCCSKIFQLSEEFDNLSFICMAQISKTEIAAIDSKNRIYKIDTKHYQKSEKQNYLKYVDYKRQLKQTEKDKPKRNKIRLSSQYSLQGLPQQKILKYNLNLRSNLLAIVYSQQIVFVSQPFKDDNRQREMVFVSSSTEVRKFRSLIMFKSQGNNVYLIECKNGDTFFLFEKDIETLILLLKQASLISLNFSFAGFSFYKQSSQPIGYLQINIQQQLNEKTLPTKYLYQQSIICIQSINAESSSIIRLNGFDYEYYKMDDQFSSHYPKLSVCALQNEEQIFNMKIQSEGFILHINTLSQYLQDIHPKYNHNLNLSFINNDFTQWNQNSLKDLLSQRLDSSISEQILELLKEQLIVSHTLTVANKTDLVYFIGTDQGNIYGIPFYWYKNKKYRIYHYGTNNNKPICNMKFSKNCLFAQNTQHQLWVFNLGDLPLQLGDQFGVQISQMVQSYTMILNDQLQSLLKIRQISFDNDQVVTHKKKDKPLNQVNDFTYIRRKFLKNLIAFQILDGTIFIFSNTFNKCMFMFQNVFQNPEGHTYQIYLHLKQEYFIIIHQNQASLWSVETGNFEKLVSLEYIVSLLQLDRQVESQFSQLVQYNNFKQFQQISKLDSQCFDLLEYSFRSFSYQLNYRKELSSKATQHQLSYESLGLFTQLQSNSLELQQVIKLLHHDSQSIVTIQNLQEIFRFIRIVHQESSFLHQDRQIHRNHLYYISTTHKNTNQL